MDDKTKHSFLLVGFGVTLFAALMNIGEVTELFARGFDALYPVVLGFIIAFVLNVPMSFFERLLARASKKPSRAVSLLCLAATLACVLVVLAIALTMLFPAVAASLVSLREIVSVKMPEWSERLSVFNIGTGYFTGFINSLELDWMIKHFTGSAGELISSAAAILTNAVSGIANLTVALIVALYILMSKHMIAAQVKRLLCALVKKQRAETIIHVSEVVCDTYSRFLSGQFIESCILGGLVCVSLSVFCVPYAALMGLLCGIMSFVPYVGGIGACAVGTFLVALSDPSRVIVFVVICVTVQFIENQFIYPRVVGGSVGLGSVWTFLAAAVGGRLFGFFGMVFFIPLAAAISKLLSEKVRGE